MRDQIHNILDGLLVFPIVAEAKGLIYPRLFRSQVLPFTITVTYSTAANGSESGHSRPGCHSRESGNPPGFHSSGNPNCADSPKTGIPELDARLRGHDTIA